MKKILITGCAGFIGYHLCKKLESKYKIVGVDNLNEYYDKNLKRARLRQLSNDVSFHEIDICSKNDIYNLFKSYQFEYVIHLAAQAGVRYSFESPKTYIDNNISGTVNILEILKSYEGLPLFFSSSSSVYGNTSENLPFDENSITDKPISLYSASKKSCELIIHNYCHNFKIPATILRFFTVYGPWGRPDMALFKFVKAILEGEPIDIYNKGELWRDFTFIDDLTECFYRILDKTPSKNSYLNSNNDKNYLYRIINIGNQNAVKLMDFVETLESIMGKKAEKNFIDMQAGDVKFTLSNNNLMKSLIEYTPSTPLHDGIKKFYDWYVDYYKI